MKNIRSQLSNPNCTQLPDLEQQIIDLIPKVSDHEYRPQETLRAGEIIKQSKHTTGLIAHYNKLYKQDDKTSLLRLLEMYTDAIEVFGSTNNQAEAEAKVGGEDITNEVGGMFPEVAIRKIIAIKDIMSFEFDVESFLRTCIEHANDDGPKKDWSITDELIEGRIIWTPLINKSTEAEQKKVASELILEAIKVEGFHGLHYALCKIKALIREYGIQSELILYLKEWLSNEEKLVKIIDNYIFLSEITPPKEFNHLILSRIQSFAIINKTIESQKAQIVSQSEIDYHRSGSCGYMYKYHKETLLGINDEEYSHKNHGKVVLIYIDNILVGSMKMIGDPTILGLTNLTSSAGKSIVRVGYIYGTTKEIIDTVEEKYANQRNNKWVKLKLNEIKLNEIKSIWVKPEEMEPIIKSIKNIIKTRGLINFV